MSDSVGITGAAVTASAVATPWIVSLNEYLQAGVHAVAIVAGVATAVHYIVRTVIVMRERKNK